MNMDSNKIMTGNNFSFVYDGKESDGYLYTFKQHVIKDDENEKIAENVFSYEFGVAVIKKVIYYKKYDSFYEKTYLKNVSSEITKTFSRVFDFTELFEFDRPTKTGIGYSLSDDNIRIYTYQGSVLRHDEFLPAYRYLWEGDTREFCNNSGRSSEGRMPYFNFNRLDKGVVLGIGWSGNWVLRTERPEQGVKVSTGVAGVEFFMNPGELLEMSSVLYTFYDGGYQEGQNKFRRVMKYRMSVIGHVKSTEDLPVSLQLWGAMNSDKQIEIIEKYKVEKKIPLNYVWMDAGWYGYSTHPCINEHEGDWGCHTGSWVINKNHHPDGLLDVSKKMKDAGMKFLLWFEPERVIKGTDVTKQHPDWFIKSTHDTWLLNYGNDEAVKGTFEMISNIIETLGLSCYRQDFNVNPLPYWDENDEPGRKGITQIKDIAGLYKLWDMLLERFPNLIIDNCASGGRRLDFELMSRAIAVTRSDYQCCFNPDEMTFQNHTAGACGLLPYLGTYAGYPGWDMNKYTFRSCYAPTLSLKTNTYANWDMVSEGDFEKLKVRMEEYIWVQPFIISDFYNLTLPEVVEGSWGCEQENRATPDDTVWAVWQFNRKEEGDGIILAFRRAHSSYSESEFSMFDLEKGKMYEFTDVDSGEKWTAGSDELMNGKFILRIENKAESRLLKYRICR